MRGNRRPNTIRRYDEGMLLQWPMAPRTRVNATSLTAIGYAPTWSEKTTTTNSTAPSARQIPAIRRGVSGRTRLPPRMNSAKRFGATAPRQTRARTPAIAAPSLAYPQRLDKTTDFYAQGVSIGLAASF